MGKQFSTYRINTSEIKTERKLAEKSSLKALITGFAIAIFLLLAGSVSFAQTTWEAYEANPIITMGDQLAGAQWNDPSVLKENSGYIMYLTANLNGPGENVVPFRATSTNGINWDINTTPLLLPGQNSSDFDHVKIETPSVIFFNNQYHMYYTGVQTDLSGSLSIGHATSSDGVLWTKDSANPVITPTGNFNDWNGAQVAEPGAVVVDNSIYVYFTAVGLRNSDSDDEPFAISTVGLAVSTDGSSFTAPARVLEQGALYPASEHYVGYSTPNALVVDDVIHLYYDVAQILESENPSWVQVALHHAVSSDGFIWYEDEAPIFVRSEFNWTKREIRAPTVIQNGDSLEMWFAGDDYLASGIWGIGYASASWNLSTKKDPVIDNPHHLQLEQNYPNPFNPVTTFRYFAGEQSHVTIKIYNTLGQHIHTLVDEQKAIGEYSILWNGRDKYGINVPSGIYLYEMQAAGQVLRKKLILLR